MSNGHKYQGPFTAAPELAEAGYRVFPIKPEEKNPSIHGGFYAATVNLAKIAGWLEKERRGRHNLAIATGFPSDLVVIEADDADTYKRLEERYGPPTVISAHKHKAGGHWYFAHPGDGKVPSKFVGESFPGAYCKGDGGYALAPPSTRKEWTNGIPDKAQLPPLPPELRPEERTIDRTGAREVSEKEYGRAVEAISRHVSGVSQGERHEHLMHLCGVLLPRDIGDAEGIMADAWKAVGGDLAERAEREVRNAIRSTEVAIAEERATGVPSMEKITPGLYEELADIFGWRANMKLSPNGSNSVNSVNRVNSVNPVNPVNPISAADLLAMDLKPPQWVIRDVLPEGVTLLAGKPKKGKSWMALQACVNVATGAKAFGAKDTAQGDSLYLALEDNTRRLHKRLKKILQGAAPPAGFSPAGFYVTTEWPRLVDGGTDALDRWLEEHPDARLVVIDTLAKVRQPARGNAVYQEDYTALETLLPLAAKHSVAIVVIHHLRKMAGADPQDEISSSTGLTGGVDGWMILRRTPGSQGPSLLVDGRDIEEPTEYALKWNMDNATWLIEGSAEERNISRSRRKIDEVLQRSPEPMSPKEVADLIEDSSYSNVKTLMFKMLSDGQLTKNSKGKYSPVNRVNGVRLSINPLTDFQNPLGKPETDASVNGVNGVTGDGLTDPDMMACYHEMVDARMRELGDDPEAGGSSKVPEQDPEEVDPDDPARFWDLTLEERLALLYYVRRSFKPGPYILEDPIGSASSYALKHVFERQPYGFYLYNGAFKGAMREAGFEPLDPDKQNWTFTGEVTWEHPDWMPPLEDAEWALFVVSGWPHPVRIGVAAKERRVARGKIPYLQRCLEYLEEEGYVWLEEGGWVPAQLELRGKTLDDTEGQ
jgi:hypothetical protein